MIAKILIRFLISVRALAETSLGTQSRVEARVKRRH
jgi:hypothetical protein